MEGDRAHTGSGADGESAGDRRKPGRDRVPGDRSQGTGVTSYVSGRGNGCQRGRAVAQRARQPGACKGGTDCVFAWRLLWAFRASWNIWMECKEKEEVPKMKNNVTPKFTANLSSNIEKISNGKYNKVSVNDEKGMIVEIPSGEYVSAEKLSAGTIEQLYLSLRLSMVKEISEETMPIILDEAFAYYDDERLENTLKFIAETFSGNQILLFTCSHREEEILNRIDKEYQLIELNS